MTALRTRFIEDMQTPRLFPLHTETHRRDADRLRDSGRISTAQRWRILRGLLGGLERACYYFDTTARFAAVCCRRKCLVDWCPGGDSNPKPID